MKMNVFAQYKGLRKEVYILFFGNIVTKFGSMIWTVLTLILNQKLGMNASQISLYMIASGALILPANFIGGKLADRLNKKNIIVFCDTVSVVSFILCGMFPLRLSTIVILTLGSTFQTVEHPAYHALLADLTLTKDRDKAFSLLYLGTNLGFLTAPTIAGLLFNNYLWLVFIISGVSIGISTLLIAFKLKDTTPVEDTSKVAVYQKSKDKIPLAVILQTNKTLLLFILAAALMDAAYNEYSYLLPLDIGNIHGTQGPAIFGTVSSLNGLVVILFTPIVTTLLAKSRQTLKMSAANTFIFMGYAVFVIGLGVVPLYYLAMVLCTIGEVLSATSFGPYESARIPSSHRGRVLGLFALVESTLNGIITFIIGRIYDSQGSIAAWKIVLSMLILSQILFACLIFADRKNYPNLYIKESYS